MNLEDINPRPSKIYLSKTGKEYRLRPWTLQDQIWMKQEYGDKLNEIFNENNIDIVAISRMIYRLLADKTDFKSKEIKDIDENGKEISATIGGYQLLITMIKDVKEQFDLVAALTECIGMSSEIVGELRNASVKTEKKS